MLDLAGKARGQSVSELLGGGFRNAVEVHGAVGWFEDAGEMAAAAAEQCEKVRTLKLYVGPGGSKTIWSDCAPFGRPSVPTILS